MTTAVVADLFESASYRAPESAVLFYATDDDQADEQVERLIRTADFEPAKADPPWDEPT